MNRFSPRMGLTDAHRDPADPVPVVISEAAVAVAVGVLGLVLLPEQVKGDPLAPQLAMYGRPVGFRPCTAGGRRRRVKQGFQFLRLTGRGRRRPRDTDLLGTADQLTHCSR